jgi:uncharacterized membrane protein YdbT with pleckstrin-like domain
MDFFNDGYKEYLKSGDRVVSMDRMDESYAIADSFVKALFVLLVFSPMWIAPAIKFRVMDTAILVQLVLWLAIGLVMALRYRSFHFVITQSGVYEVGGLVFKHARFVAFGRITDGEVRRGLLDHLFGTGTIGISTAGGTKSSGGHSQPYEIRIRGVKHYSRIREMIFKNMK